MRAIFFSACVIAGATIAACSAGSSGSESSGSGGANSTGTGTHTGAASGSGGSTGVVTGSTGAGGLDIPDSGGQDVNTGDGACEVIAQEAKPEFQPADIIWAIDTSGSMIEEIGFVIQEMNNFSQQITASGIDVHVIMLAAYPACDPWNVCIPGICIHPPLGAQNGCANPFNDTNLPAYFHHPTASVNSHDGLNVLIDTFPSWKPHLRPNSTKTVVIVSDDNATDPPHNDATTFINDFKALDPALLGNFKMSGIYCFTQCPSAAAVGTVWKDIIDQTGGIHGDLCQQNFQPIFNDLASGIITGSQKLDCQWTIPPPPPGQMFDPNKVNVQFTDSNNMQKDILFVSNQAACDPLYGGWYYDNNASPTTIYACPASCTEIQAVTMGKIDILFGCETISLPPP